MTCRVRKQYHFWRVADAFDAWDVDRLIELSRVLPVEMLVVAEIDEVDHVYWFNDQQTPTVRRVVEHARRILDVDPTHAIILGPDGRVMDGMHRIARAMLEGRELIPAVTFPVLPPPDYRSCQPEEVPR